LTSISRIQRPLRACFRLLYDDDDDDELLADSVDNTPSGKLFHIGTIWINIIFCFLPPGD